MRVSIRRLAEQLKPRINWGNTAVLIVLEGAQYFYDRLRPLLPAAAAEYFIKLHISPVTNASPEEISFPESINQYLVSWLRQKNKEILIIEDIIDTGSTITSLTHKLVDMGACSSKITVASMTRKLPLCLAPASKWKALGYSKHMDAVPMAYAREYHFATTIFTDAFLIGCGLDLDGEYRQLPYIGELIHATT